MDQRVEKLAEILVFYSNDIQKGQKVEIAGHAPAAPLIEAVYRKVLTRGGLPSTRIYLSSIEEALLRHGDERQLAYYPETRLTDIETLDAIFSIWFEENTRAYTSVDPSRQAIYRRSRRKLFDIMMERMAQEELRWCGTIYPSNAYAQDAEMSLKEFADFFFSACLADQDDPVELWRKFSQEQRERMDFLDGKKTVRIVAPETDLTLSIEGRTFDNCDGHENMPDGEICTSPVENSAQGNILFSYPAIENGREVENVRLWFQNGKVIKATASKNEEFLDKMLDVDEGSRFLGEFAIGTNKGITRFTKNILFDEKISGTIHLALGAGFSELGGRNKSALHWDMVCDLRHDGELFVDGQLFMKDGKFCFGE